MKIDFRLSPNMLSEDERRFLSSQIRFATRYHDTPLAGVRIELVPRERRWRARMTAVEHGGTTVVTERDAASVYGAIAEAITVLDRALHTASMSRRGSVEEVWAA